LFWKDTHGKHPNPFTVISAKDIENGVWTPSVPSLYKRMLDYAKSLESSGRYPLLIWPPHCLIGTPGAAIVPELMEALNEWCTLKTATVDYVTKGSNIYTEHYSAVRAEVPDPSDPTTQLNTTLIKTIEDADVLVWAGEAGSHCLSNTMRDAFDAFGIDSIKKSVVLTDCTSPVKGFEQNQADFFKEFAAKGVQFVKSTDFLV
jgi:nicotinamidase-related amidase